MPFDNWPPPAGPVVSYDEDFDIRYDRPTIVRVPSNAAEIILNSGDWKFGDNVTESNCGLLLTLPNRKKPVPTLIASTKGLNITATDDLETDGPEEVQARIAPKAYPSPTATSFSGNPFKATASADSRSQWRGWYEQSGGTWTPQWSYWHGARPNSTHKGWDIFSPTGSKLIAPVGPSYLHFYPVGQITGYGNVAAFFFSYGSKQYVAMYAHCSDFIGRGDRQVNMGEDVAHSGCTDVSSCGTELAAGGRTDHVHVGLYEGQLISDPHGKPINPATFFNWSPVIPTKTFAAELYARAVRIFQAIP
jgi:hypothetical protein